MKAYTNNPVKKQKKTDTKKKSEVKKDDTGRKTDIPENDDKGN